MAELAKAPTVSQEGDLFVLDLGDGENRLNADWMDAVESAIGAAEAAAPPRALVTVASGKFWSNGLDLESLHVQALELAIRRAGFRSILLSFDLPPERVARAMRAVEPTAFVFCGGEATLEVLGRLVYTVRQVGSAAPVFEYREAMPVTGDHSIPSLGSTPNEAAENLKQYVDTGKIEHTKVVQDDAEAEVDETSKPPVRLAAQR